jgi:serine/threonine-protein kinase ULK/ATG1
MHYLDFGLAQYLSAEDQNSSLKGSPLYMAPEILLKHEYNAQVDLWSVGVIMYECLFGRAPYSSDNFKELAEKIKLQVPIQVMFNNHS